MRILVVEDDRKVAGFIEQGLLEEGYVVDVARDGEEATMLAHVNEYDVILLDVVRYDVVVLDRLRHVATANDRPLDLTPKEFQLLEYFLLHAEEVVRRTTLLEKVWDMQFDPESNVIDVHIKNLRRKLAGATGESLLANIRGVGFSLRRRRESEEARVTP